jgi:hypothetical protein
MPSDRYLTLFYGEPDNAWLSTKALCNECSCDIEFGADNLTRFVRRDPQSK